MKSTEKQAMLELVSLTKRFGDRVAVEGLSLTVGRSEFYALLGPNAAGKTTTVKMIAGLLRPSAGSVRIAGHDVLGDDLKVKSLVGYVPEFPFLYERLTVEETLDFAAALHGMAGEDGIRAREEALSLFILSGERWRLAGELSRGMRQRLAFAIAMIHRPRLMLVDEPFIGLDPRGAREVKDALRNCARGGGAVFMCTHMLPVAEELADRIGIISGGRMVAQGTLPDLRKMTGEGGGLEDIYLSVTMGDEV